LLRNIHNRYKAKLILIGAQEDNAEIDLLIASSAVPAVNAAGKTPLSILPAILKRANLFVGLDSGPAHISAVAGAPSVVLYSGTNRLEEWGPKGKNAVVITKEVPCSSCEKLSCIAHLCMENISVKDVEEAINKVASL